jgi:hypothetical protein
MGIQSSLVWSSERVGVISPRRMLNPILLAMVRVVLLIQSPFNWPAALAVDMTARNLQDHVKKRGLPWSAAKGFDTFTPIG